MASIYELYRVSVLLIPIISSIFAMLLLLLDIYNSNKKSSKLHFYLFSYFSSICISWFSAIIFFYLPMVYVRLNCISMLSLLLTSVFYYGFIFEATRIDKKEGFSNLNYLFPVIISLLLLIVSINTPIQDQMNTITAKGKYIGGSKLFFYFNYSKIFVRITIGLIYIFFCFKRLFKYRRVILNISSNEEKNSLRWVTTLLIFSLLLIPVPMIKIFDTRDNMVLTPIAFFFVISLCVQYVYICLHAIKRDRFIFDFDDNTSFFHNPYLLEECIYSANQQDRQPKYCIEKTERGKYIDSNEDFKPYLTMIDNNDEEVNNLMSHYLKKNILNKDAFDSFMKFKKPYLNPYLKITDLVNMLHVNRTYISSFINREYGVNFSVFINKYRLLEYNALKKMPEYCMLNESELSELAGFNSYRSFQRTKKKILKTQTGIEEH